MIKKIFVFAIFALSLNLAVFAQDAMMSNDKMMMKKEVTAAEASKTALNVGAKMPAFSLKDAIGNIVSSDDMLKQGNLVVVFYRGAWCPYCNTYLRSLQKNISDIKANGGQLVAISVENPDNSMKVSDKNKLEFSVLSDPNLEVARNFGIVFQLDAKTDEKYKGYGIDLVKMNGTEKPELPLSATYIINKNGEIVYAFLDPDFTKRAEPSVIIETLKKIKGDSMKMEMKMDKKN
ncbi:MAG TPA: peroxiredoxin-like family protein [Pyrinomonadaceae bacterium]|nr:peroxiredoxin-like family protein [Pyrinomonadaceae bacterium]